MMTNDALIAEINSAYRRLSAASEDLVRADRKLAEHVRRVRLDNAEAILEATNERTASLYLDGLLDTDGHHPDFERSFRFYAESLGLPVYREWGSGSTKGVVFFLRGGFLELSGSSRSAASESVSLWMQVRDVGTVGLELEEAGVEVFESPTDKPWGLREMQIRDPDGLSIVIVEVPESHPLRRR